MRDTVTGGALTEATLFILLALYRPNHGYGIMQFAERETDGRLLLGPGTLYGALNTLQQKGWIEPAADVSAVGRKKKYVITALGKEIVGAEIGRLAQVLQCAKTITGGD